MSPENHAPLERRKNIQQAVVLKDPYLDRIHNNGVRDVLKGIGISSKELGHLLLLEFDPVERFELQTVTNKQGEKTTDIVSYIADSSVGKIEVAEVKVYPPVVGAEYDEQETEPIRKGTEIIYGVEGAATLSLPDEQAENQVREVEIRPGILVIIPNHMNATWAKVEDSFHFRYVRI